MHKDAGLPSLERLDWAAQIKDYAIITLDLEGRVTTWNAGAALVKGYDAAEIVGRSFHAFYTAEQLADGTPERLLATARRDGRVEDLGWRVRRDGSQFWADVVITALHDEDGVLTGFIKVTRDLSEQRRMQHAREIFISGLGHDFRSPLTSIEGYAQLLCTDLEDPALVDFAQRIRANAVRIMSMVDQLVEQAKLHSGTVEVHVEPVELGPFVAAVVGDLGGALAGREVRVHGAEGVVVAADPDALSRVLVNVLGNAVKYSPEGAPVDVHVEPAGVQGRRPADAAEAVSVVVADRGRGIDPADRELVFSEYERGRRAQRDGGFGLGLAVVRQLMELMGGSATVEDGRHGGTDVVLVLPRA
ncbi:HAMP domain-containing sensor histidine kinase [Nocardioides sp. GY 10127]|uniref:PAS domain-containing sensor histidine kinase n=1 Tax=Nocardioides sp. GY 10127 TaxID=2569762 RepID=UPI0010A919B1|nr:HAMP domain-containing sensor histidine kinase [Nocardioides sp. GY 10127]TIC86583.1 HAMP domain-containing histidine kinase [Nocardioides sp. GY 10127]